MPLIDTLALRRSLVAAGMNEGQADALASALGRVDTGSPVTRRDVDDIVGSLHREVTSVRRGVVLLVILHVAAVLGTGWLVLLHSGRLALTAWGG